VIAAGGHDVVVVALIGAVPATIAAIAAFSASRTSKKGRAENAAGQAEIAAGMETGNLKRLGETVHDIAQTVEVIEGQVHQSSRELRAVRERLEAHLESVTGFAPEIFEAEE
jgi:hypothetical protein